MVALAQNWRGICAGLAALLVLLILLLRRTSHRFPLVGPDWRSVSSISTIIAGQRIQDGALLLWSIALFGPPGIKVFVASDEPTVKWFETRMPVLLKSLDVNWSYRIDGYNMSMQRGDMIKAGVWSDFQMEKAHIMEYALTQANDTVFLDADCMFLSPIMVPFHTQAQLGLAPHYMKVEDSREYGFFNGGVVWTNQASMPRHWVTATTPESRYYDQTSLEDLAQWYRTYVFGPETDLGWWRIKHGQDGEAGFWQQVGIDARGQIAFRGKAVDVTHAHFLTADHGNSKPFVDGVLKLMHQSPRYAVLLEVIEWGRRDFMPPVPQGAWMAGPRSSR